MPLRLVAASCSSLTDVRVERACKRRGHRPSDVNHTYAKCIISKDWWALVGKRNQAAGIADEVDDAGEEDSKVTMEVANAAVVAAADMPSH